MPTFLHKPVREAALVAKLKARAAPESQHLEFKGGFWEDAMLRCPKCGPTSIRASAGVEAAKDVAAMANASGGDIIVGIDDTNDRASGWWGGKRMPDDAEETLRRWLRNYLAPREAADSVEIRMLAITESADSSVHRILSINVPPWPYGPVAVQTDIDPQKAQYRVPFRRDRDTIYRSAEEIMRLNEGTRRSIYLRLVDLVGTAIPENVGFHLRSSMQALVGGGIDTRPAGIRDGVIVSFTNEIVVLSLENFSQRQHNGNQSIPAARMTVPLELVTAAWRDPDAPTHVALALAGPIMWDGRKWVIFGGR
jgi:hypothetical protein